MLKKIVYEYESFTPYRVCPLGAHIDHQLGIVTGFTIDKGITMKYNKREDGVFFVSSHDFNGVAYFYLDKLPEKDNAWQDYLVGSICVLSEKYELTSGIEAYICDALPVGGLASSSAIIISYILAIAKVNNINLEKKELVELVVKVEREYLNTKIGTLDPSCEIYCQKDSLLYLDTKDNSYKIIKPKKELNFKVCLIYSGVSRKLTNTIYNIRVEECKTTAFLMNSLLQNAPTNFSDCYLRNISYDDFIKYKNHFPVNHIKRATHFYTEMDRVKEGIKYFQDGDLINFGKLIYESGTSSIEKYETGSEQLEKLHEISKKTDGIYGGRFSGAGFNGYYMAIVDPLKEEKIRNFITEEYLKVYPQYKDDFKIYFCNIKDGVKL